MHPTDITPPPLDPPVDAHDHVRGAFDAPVTLVEYGDYECPACGAAHPVVLAVERRFGAQLRFVYRHFPLVDVHPHAELAAEAAEAVAEEGSAAFWIMHDLLFTHQHTLDVRHLLAYALEAGADMARVGDELEWRTRRPVVEADAASGLRSGVERTPTFFIDGVRFDGYWDEDALAAEILSRLRARSASHP